MKSPVELYSKLFEDIRRLEPGVKGLDRDLLTIQLRFENEGFSFLSKTLPTICHALDRGLADGQYACPSSFSKKGALPKLLSGLLCGVFDKEGRLLENACVYRIKLIREITCLFKKLSVSSKDEVKLDLAAAEKFETTDASLEGLSEDPLVNFYVDSVSRFILPNLDSIDLRDLKCKHGPGSVNEGHKPNQKWKGVVDDLFMDGHTASLFGFDLNLYSTDLFDGKDSVLTDFVQPLEGNPHCIRTGRAKLVSVPKDSTSRRTITVEPVLLQFLQQGLNTALRDSILECRVLSNSLSLSDQGRNQTDCVLSSIHGKRATVDLSSASDLLSLKLVERVFSGRPKFLFGLTATRSSEVTTRNRVLKLKKYAGMGNATTFPVQSVVFAVLAIASLLHSEGKFPSYGNVVRASKSVRVYGDDIIVPSSSYTSLSRWLTTYGLKINHRKSFATGFFRESCGVDSYKGVDVTPLYIKEWPTLSGSKADLVAHLVERSNAMFDRCLYSAADYLRTIVEDLTGPLPLVSRKSQGLGWYSRVDTNIATKWDGKLQRPVFQGLVISSPRRSDVLDGYPALVRFFVESDKRNYHPLLVHTELSNVSSPVRFKNRLRRKWLPAQVG